MVQFTTKIMRIFHFFSTSPDIYHQHL